MKSLLLAIVTLSSVVATVPSADADPALGFVFHARPPASSPSCGAEQGVTIVGTYESGSGTSETWRIAFSGRAPFPQNCPGVNEGCTAVGSIESGFASQGCTFSWSLTGTAHAVPASAATVTLTLSNGPYTYSVAGTMVVLTSIPAPVPTPGVVHVRLKIAPEPLALDPGVGIAVWLVDPSLVPVLNPLPGVAGCILSVPDPDLDGEVDGVAVMQHATGAGCIDGYIATFGGCFVTEIDGLAQGPGFWIEYKNDLSGMGICGDVFEEGDSMGWIYQTLPL